MADFEQAAAGVLLLEGKYEAPSPADPGGETNFGISKRSYPDEDIRNMTPERAKQIYRADYWRFDAIPDQALANKFLSLTVQLGLPDGARLIQRSLVPFFPGAGIAIDGVFGSKTAEMVNRCAPAELLGEVRARYAQRICQDLAKNPAESGSALGLFRRAAR